MCSLIAASKVNIISLEHSGSVGGGIGIYVLRMKEWEEEARKDGGVFL
jgi:hypothetical protein